MADDIIFNDNSNAIINELQNKIAVALEEIGMRAEGYAAVLTPVGTPESTQIEGYSTSGLRQSMTHKVVGNEVYIGSNKTYAAYVEYGTGIYAADGTGRQSPWIWIDKNGKGHWTRGMKPQHMLKQAVSNHTDEYKRVLENHLKNG